LTGNSFSLAFKFEAMRSTRKRLSRPGSFVLAALVALLLMTVGCKTFSHAWTKATAQPVSTNSVLGRWEGTWNSDANGHNGSLRCVISRKKDGSYGARFHAVYKKVLGFGYSVPLEVTETNGTLRFSGEANLGWWAGGVYNYEGFVHESNFFSTYRCKYDYGTFQMTRPFQLNGTQASQEPENPFLAEAGGKQPIRAPQQ
jgi:hypothetical protein